jgi:hypothetical protein
LSTSSFADSANQNVYEMGSMLSLLKEGGCFGIMGATSIWSRLGWQQIIGAIWDSVGDLFLRGCDFPVSDAEV